MPYSNQNSVKRRELARKKAKLYDKLSLVALVLTASFAGWVALY